MSTSELIARAVIPAVLVLALIGVPIALWWEKRRPTVPKHVAQMRAWRAMSAAEQEAVDTASLDLAEQAALDAELDAQESAQLAVERATEINTLSRF